ncbi:MAG: transposase [Kiritimatiellae bacterium]|nr:transposase [Kiritimatiellia bacterium]
MRRPRVKVEGEGFYHVVSRIGGKRFLIDEKEKAILLGMIRGAAEFSGVELYTFAIMSNHFHLLVRVPRKREVSDKELEKRMLSLYGPVKFNAVLKKWARWTKRNQEDRVEDEKTRMRARMYDLSQFCKTFKEAYTQDYNKRHENTGTIWEGRFKSILLEGSFRALMTVAGYVHLNPVRAAMADAPEDAKWTGYGAGCQGDAKSRAGLQGLVARVYGAKAEETTWKRAQEVCADVVGGHVSVASTPEGGDDVVETDSKGRPVRAGSLKALLAMRSAGFVHGGALGSAAFLKRVAGSFPKRKRSKSDALFDRCPFLALSSATGVRETTCSA